MTPSSTLRFGATALSALFLLFTARAASTNPPAPARLALVPVITNAAAILSSTSTVLSLNLDPQMLVAMMASLDEKQKLGSGDKVTYRVIEDQDLPRSLTVTDTGDLDVPYYGLVPAARKSCRQLASDIKGLLEKQLYFRATVIIGLEQINRKRMLGRVYVVGQVKQNGPQEILDEEELKVSQAILKAGGFTDFADKKKVKLVRAAKPGEAEKKSFVINVSDIWEKGRLENDMKLEADDLVFVPARLVNF